ncbi:DUF602-domain-containing protein [Sphaerulina musiva SO2202]|uniref:DUF602-domain-containing protein n=1 Tax=Sphaerulina musiva (strain SO2202) TaxID=692275 RepID=M3AXE3_SPHMS|nr:DUF602-domain-containing protein [Sphaerulina musiva SO2202]EMF11405.1 DUF602-domain-containing protein [Sphaerulina musiva SO2202]
MGNDGGSIPTRRELVKEAAKDKTTTQVKEVQHEQQEYYWTTDPISREPLTQPVVSDSSGKLYNKSTILEYLVESARKEDADTITQGAIKSLKDVVEVKFEIDTAATSSVVKGEAWKCPITGDKLGPGSKAVYLVPCGHAFSGSAIKEVSGEKCLTCESEYATNDVIPILPTGATDIARLAFRVKTLQEKGLAHSLKKSSGGKKRKKGKEENGEVEEKVKKTKEDSSGINNSSAASIAAKVLKEQELSKKKKMQNENVKSLFSTRDQSKPIGKSADFMTRGFSVPSENKR